MELISWSFSEEEASSCSNIPAAVEMLVVWHKAMPTYIEGDSVYIEFNAGLPDVVSKG